MKQLPVGVQDFIELRKTDKYYVDKSMLIGQILSQNDLGVYLYTRPRRFGKSLNLSMLDAFFNIKYKGNTWFDGLEISRHPEFDSYRNAFPVIYLDLKETDSKTKEGFFLNMNGAILGAYKEHLYLRESGILTEDEENLFKGLMNYNVVPEILGKSLKVLSEALERYHGSKVVVLIDEYDNAANRTEDCVLRQDMVDFIGKLLSHTLKGNNSLQIGIVTGIMQIVKADIFSGVNNLSVNNITDTESDEMFGFTDKEVKQVCTDYGHPEKFEEAKEWYDGYRFGDVDIYNPWSILNYIQKNFKPDCYWLGTGSSDIITNVIMRADDELTDNLRILGSGGSINHEVTTMLTSDDLNDPDTAYSLMAISGYLKAIPKGNEYELSIPNRELFTAFSKMINSGAFKTRNGYGKLKNFTDAVMSNNTQVMKSALYELIVAMSSRVLDNEHSYQAFITGMLMSLCGNYDVKADFENGKGYYDIMMEKKKGIGPNVVMELKKSSDSKHLENDANAALRQIKDRDYAHGLEGKTILYGIAFSGKEPFIISEEI